MVPIKNEGYDEATSKERYARAVLAGPMKSNGYKEGGKYHGDDTFP